MSELPKSVSDAFNEYYANAHGIPEHGPAYNFALTQVRWLWNFLSAGAETLPEIYNSCAHPQAVWFETHWRPIFAKQMARIAAAELKNAQNMSRRQEAEHVNALLEREITALRDIPKYLKAALNDVERGASSVIHIELIKTSRLEADRLRDEREKK